MVALVKEEEAQPERTRVFVYGSLKRGYGLEHNLDHQLFIGEDVLHGYHMISLGVYPAIFRTAATADCRVHGEVYDVTNACLNRLDEVEGVPNFYHRATVRLETHGAAQVYCHHYPSNRRSFERVMGGVWRGKNTPTVEVTNQSHPDNVKERALQLGREPPRKPRCFYNRETNQWMNATTLEIIPLGAMASYEPEIRAGQPDPLTPTHPILGVQRPNLPVGPVTPVTRHPNYSYKPPEDTDAVNATDFSFGGAQSTDGETEIRT